MSSVNQAIVDIMKQHNMSRDDAIDYIVCCMPDNILDAMIAEHNRDIENTQFALEMAEL